MRYRRSAPLILIPLLAGCGTFQAGPTGISGEGSEITDREGAYYLAQRDAAIAAAHAAAAPIFELEAVPGQTLEIRGLGRIAVRAPGTGQNAGVRQYVNPWAEVVGHVAGSVLPLAVGQLGAYGIVRELGRTTEAIAGTTAALSSDGFGALAQSGQQTAEIATHGMDQVAAAGQAGIAGVRDTAQAGFAQIGDTAQAGITATAETGQAGITAVRGTAESGFAALTSTSQFALGELGDTARFGMGAVQGLGETGIVAAGRDPVIVPPADPVIVQPADPVIITQPDPVIVTQPDPIFVDRPVFIPTPP